MNILFMITENYGENTKYMKNYLIQTLKLVKPANNFIFFSIKKVRVTELFETQLLLRVTNSISVSVHSL